MATRRPPGLGELALRTLGEMALGAARQLHDMVPPETRLHLVRAQRELVLAAVAALEHGQQPAPAARRRSRRVRKISLD